MITAQGNWRPVDVFILSATLFAAPVVADAPNGSGDWKFDAVHLKNGAVLQGLIDEETSAAVRFHNIRRKPGRPTVVFQTTIRHGEIAKIDRLTDADRVALKQRLQELEQNSPQTEKERMEGLALEVVAWRSDPKGGRRYASDFFVLTSNAPEEIVRRAAVRLEQIYTAYSRYLPPRHVGGPPTAVQLIVDVAEYQKIVAEFQQSFLNPAFFDPASNRIVCASDLRRFGEDLADVRQKHRAIRRDLDRQAAELSKLYSGKELRRVLEPIEQNHARITKADRINEELFNKATRQLFATLYHEAFHAYLSGFVYPPRAGELPRWLNEGLAQIFESAIVEAGELRVGHADAGRLAAVQESARKRELLPLADLLQSTPKQFLLTHAGDRQAADRHYLMSWALAFYLSFERRLLGSEALDQYVRKLKENTEATTAFEELVGQKLPEFEAEFRKYLQQLQPDGTVLQVGK